MLAFLTTGLALWIMLRAPQGRLGNYPCQRRGSGPVGNGPLLQIPRHPSQLIKANLGQYPYVALKPLTSNFFYRVAKVLFAILATALEIGRL
jgi:hypothetical protein